MERTTRYSKKREVILEAIRGTDTHPTADWVYQTLKPNHPDPSLGTVYRNLALFKEQGMVKCVGVVSGQERFDANTDPHTHFVCDRCDAVLDLHKIPVDPALDAQVGAQYGLDVDHHELVFHGICGSCQSKSK
ncbi:MAG: transcriptional repressor, partial [Pseudoflavonifractor sp.]